MSNHDLYDSCFVESDYYPFDKLKRIIPDELFIRGICIKEKDSLKFLCTGFTIVENKILVIFPKGYTIPKEESTLKNHIRLLIAVLTKYSLNSKLESNEDTLLGGLGDNPEFISAAFWLVKDYFEHGIINFERQEYGINNSANINWARTIKSTTPIMSNQRPVYLDLVTKKHTNYENMITIIHQYAIQQCLNKYGWLFDYDGESTYEYDLPCDTDMALHILDLEAHKTFAERRTNLLVNLKEFISGSQDHPKESITTFITPYFHTVWEKICYSLFSDSNSESLPKLPNPYWNVNNIIEKTEQIPDIMFRADNKLFILDAKYYRVKYAPKRLPGWGDLVKQFFYRLTLMKDTDDIIENIFIFPGYSNNSLEYLGYAAIDGMPGLSKINGYVLDIHKAMEFYIKDEKGPFKEKLIESFSLPSKNV